MDFLTPQSGNFFNGYFSDPWILDPYHEVLFFRNKKETKSYIEISESLGVDEPSDILFVTDVYQEAVAAKIAGLEVMISVRPGNGPLPENHGFMLIKSFTEIPF